jgi:hypothetical protein
MPVTETDRALKAVVAGLCAYETLAILRTDDELRTITHICHDGLNHRHGKFAVWAFVALIVWHLLGHGPISR